MGLRYTKEEKFASLEDVFVKLTGIESGSEKGKGKGGGR